MTIKKYTDEDGNTYSETIIPDKIVGFSGIDPVFIPNGWDDGTGDESANEGTQDHEKLQRLLGGGASEGDHYHIDHYQHYIFNRIFDLVFPREGGSDVTHEEALQRAAKILKGEYVPAQEENP